MSRTTVLSSTRRILGSWLSVVMPGLQCELDAMGRNRCNYLRQKGSLAIIGVLNFRAGGVQTTSRNHGCTDGKILYDARADGADRAASSWIGSDRLGGRPDGRGGPAPGRASSTKGRPDRPPLRKRARRRLPALRQHR